MRYFFVLIVLFSFKVAFNQNNFESKLFISVCERILEDNKGLQFKKKIQNICVVYPSNSLDPIIDTIGNITSEEKELLRDIEEKELIEILNRHYIPLISEKDTLIIIDTINFFFKEYEFSLLDKVFKVSKNFDNSNPNYSYLYLDGIYLHDCCLKLYFRYEWYLLSYNFCPDENLKLKLLNTNYYINRPHDPR